jgi:hypothetical protein
VEGDVFAPNAVCQACVGGPVGRSGRRRQCQAQEKPCHYPGPVVAHPVKDTCHQRAWVCGRDYTLSHK